MDAATRGNAWTLVGVTNDGAKQVVALAYEWTGSVTEPLDPE